MKNTFIKADLFGLPRELKLQLSASMLVVVMEFLDKKVKGVLTEKESEKLKELSRKEALDFLKKKIPTIEKDFEEILRTTQKEFLNLTQKNH